MTKISKKPKKRKGQYSRPGSENRLFGVPDTDKSDIYYGEVAKRVNDVNKELT